MNNMFIISQIFALLGMICNIIAMQINNKKKILVCYTSAGIFYGIQYIFLNAISGAIISFTQSIESVINNNIESKNKKIPLWLVIFYLLIVAIIGKYSYKSVIDFLPIIGGIIYVILITLKKEKNIRFASLIMSIVWLIYGLLYKSIFGVISNIILIVSTIIGIYRYDIKR